MRILFFIGNMDHTGGTERVLARITGGLAQKGYEIEIASMYAGLHPVFSPGKPVLLHSLSKDYPEGAAAHLHNLYGLCSLVARRCPDVLCLSPGFERTVQDYRLGAFQLLLSIPEE